MVAGVSGAPGLLCPATTIFGSRAARRSSAAIQLARLSGVLSATYMWHSLETPAGLVRRVQPPGDFRGAAQRPRRRADLGPGTAARAHYGLGSGVSCVDTLPDLYAEWERWAADVTESHRNYL